MYNVLKTIKSKLYESKQNKPSTLNDFANNDSEMQDKVIIKADYREKGSQVLKSYGYGCESGFNWP
jgi:hypothetical protein